MLFLFVSSNKQDFERQKAIAIETVRARKPVGPDGTQVGVVVYGNDFVKTELPVGDAVSIAGLEKKINAIRFPDGNEIGSDVSVLHESLNKALSAGVAELEKDRSGRRDSVTKSMVVFVSDNVPLSDEKKANLRDIEYSIVNLEEDAGKDAKDLVMEIIKETEEGKHSVYIINRFVTCLITSKIIFLQ